MRLFSAQHMHGLVGTAFSLVLGPFDSPAVKAAMVRVRLRCVAGGGATARLLGRSFVALPEGFGPVFKPNDGTGSALIPHYLGEIVGGDILFDVFTTDEIDTQWTERDYVFPVDWRGLSGRFLVVSLTGVAGDMQMQIGCDVHCPV